DGRLDAAFVLLSSQAQGLGCHILHRDRMVLAMPKQHRLAKKSRVNVAELLDETLIVASPRHAPVLYQAALECGTRHGIALRVAYEADSMMMALSLVTSINGVSLLPEYSARSFPKDVV